jgi:ParB-like chromosome segregation protein Spo0J
MTDPKLLNPTQRISGAKSEKTIKRIVADIEEKGIAGIREPIDIIIDEETGEKYILDGHHRHKAALQKELEKVPTREITLPQKGYENIKEIRNAHAQTGIR